MQGRECRGGVLTVCFALLAGLCAAQASNPNPSQPPPGGVVPMPQGPPNTGPSGPNPAAVQALPPAQKPLLASPTLAQIKGYTADHPITLADAIAIALYTNRSLATAIANLEAARGRTGEARAALNPTVGINSQLTYFDKATSFSIPAFGPHPFTIVPQFNPVNTAAFTLPIDLGGALQSAVSQAQFNELAARIDVNRARNQVIFDVKNAFYNVLRAQAQVQVATENVNESLSRLSDANKNYSAGTSPYYDVLTAQRDVADAQRGLISANAQVSTSLGTLKNTIGLDVSDNITVDSSGATEYPNGVQAMNFTPPTPTQTEEPKPAPQANYAPLPAPSTDLVKDNFAYGPEYSSLIDEALRTRPEVLETQAQVVAAQRGVQFARRSQLPSLSLSLEYINTPNAAGFTRRNEGAAVLGVNIPIYEGGLARARVEEARAQIANAQVNNRQARDQVQLDVQQSYVALVQARDRVAVANVEVAQAREAYRLAQIRYTAGVSTQITASPQLELINAQTTLTQANTDLVNALYDYNSAKAQLDRAVGRYSYQPGTAAPAVPAPGAG